MKFSLHLREAVGFTFAVLFLVSFSNQLLQLVCFSILLFTSFSGAGSTSSMVMPYVVLIYASISLFTLIIFSPEYRNYDDLVRPLVVLVLASLMNFDSKQVFFLTRRVLNILFIGLIANQLVYVLGVSVITDFLDSLFSVNEAKKVWTHRSVAGFSELWTKNIRAGGIFRNPNQYAKYLLLLFIVLRQKRTRANLAINLATATSITLTGSRTGMIVFTAILLFDKMNWYKLLLGFIVAIGLFTGSTGFRAVNVLEGVSSLSHRVGGLDVLLNHNTGFGYLFGNWLSEQSLSRLLSRNVMFDSGILLIFWNLGVIGAILVSVSLFSWFNRFSELKAWPLALFMITGGLFFDISFMILSLFIITNFRNDVRV